MNSNQDLRQVNERLDQIEQKLDSLGRNQQNKRSPGKRFLIGLGITIAVIHTDKGSDSPNLLT